tara:strand:- start:9874 stop:10995 length:1122 start_codon:yes stop_codon:yes gene_type:complete
MDHYSDVAIIGGGVTGCSAAYYLSALGVSCTIIESNNIASYASGYAAGGLNPLEGYEIPGLLSDFAMTAYLMHLDLWGDLQSSTGIDYHGRVLDLLKICYDDSGLAALAENKNIFDSASDYGFKADLLSAAEIHELEPKVTENISGGLHVYGNAGVESYDFTRALHVAATQNGTQTIIGTAERFVSDGDKVTGVIVNGDVLLCNTVVIATGPWTREISDQLGFDIPVSPLKGEILRLRLKDGTLNYDLTDGNGSVYAKPDGLAWVGATEEPKGFDLGISDSARKQLWSGASKFVPALAEAELVLQTACLRPVTPDWLPILGRAPSWLNVFLNTGAGKKGILFGPAMGQATADLIVKGNSDTDISLFLADRFVV